MAGSTFKGAPPAAARSTPGELGGATARWKRYIVPQRHDDYTRAEHDTWRHLLARAAELVHDLNPWLHPSYIEGFRQLVEPWSKIPCVEDVSAALAAFGCNTVCVDGYIPPDVYAGLIARGTFPVSRVIRKPEHVDFSPAPDLAHDLLGHIPMLISGEYRQFLQRLAGAMAVAAGNALDRQLYRANRAMATLRCRPSCPQPKLSAARQRVEHIQRGLGQAPSMLTQLGRMYLWSIEFGLMGTPREFRIYGAGLLSSVAEIRAVCRGRAPIREFSQAVITRDIHFSDLQSTYFVARDYVHLHNVLSSLESDQGQEGAVHCIADD